MGASRTAGLNASFFYGTWQNTDLTGDGIAQLHVHPSAAGVAATVSAAGKEGLIDWGTLEAEVFASGPDKNAAQTLRLTYRFDFMEIDIQAFTKLGVLVMASFTRFTDESGRQDYFDREFFFKLEDHPEGAVSV